MWERRLVGCRVRRFARGAGGMRAAAGGEGHGAPKPPVGGFDQLPETVGGPGRMRGRRRLGPAVDRPRRRAPRVARGAWGAPRDRCGPGAHLCSSEKDSVRVCSPPRLSATGAIESPLAAGPFPLSRSVERARLAGCSAAGILLRCNRRCDRSCGVVAEGGVVGGAGLGAAGGRVAAAAVRGVAAAAVGLTAAGWIPGALDGRLDAVAWSSGYQRPF
jgi:hypothetical protein